MIVVLDDQLLHLGNRVFASARHVLGDVRNLRPDDHAVLVAQVVEIGVVLIVRQADGVCAHLGDERHVLPVVLREQRVADAPAVLMAGDAAQRIGLAVEDEALIGIDGERPAAEARGDAVQHAALLQQLDGRGVQVRIPAAVPQMDIRDDGFKFRPVGGHLGLGDDAAVRVLKDAAQRLAFLRICHIDLRADMRVPSLHHRRDRDARAAEVHQIEVGGRYADQVHVAVEAAVEREVRHLRINRVIGRVVHHHDDQRIAGAADAVGHVHAPGRVAAVVMREVPAADVHVRGGVRAADFQKQLLALGQLLEGELFDIRTGSAEVVSAAVLAVDGVIGMRQIHIVCRRGQLGWNALRRHDERPLAVEVYGLSHGIQSFLGRTHLNRRMLRILL